MLMWYKKWKKLRIFWSWCFFGRSQRKGEVVFKRGWSLPLFLTLLFLLISFSVCPQKHQTVLAVYEIKNEVSLIVGPHRFGSLSVYCLACGKCLNPKLMSAFWGSFLGLLLAQCLACGKCLKFKPISTLW